MEGKKIIMIVSSRGIGEKAVLGNVKGMNRVRAGIWRKESE